MTRKRTKRKVWPLLNSLVHGITGAAITDTASLDKLRMRELSAIESFRIGKAEKDDWMAVADFTNIAETLAGDGVGPEAMEPVRQAQEALSEAHRRHTETGRLGVTGPELESLREAYQFHDLQRLSISRSRYEAAILKTANRIRSAHPSVKVCV
jgi:hypothetical protein